MGRVVFIVPVIIFIGWQSASANLTVTPRDTESKVNDSTYFNCTTDILSKEIHWNHGVNYVYAGGLFYEPYLGRFQIEINNSTGQYNLIIPSVQPQDVGEYSCQDDGGHGKQSPAAKLIVLADEPTCHSDLIRDANSCEIDPDEVKLSCSISYYGNIPPQLQWWKASDSSPIATMADVASGNIATYSVTLKTNLSMNNQMYVCQTTRSVASQYHCSSEAIRLQYVFSSNASVKLSVGEETTCVANSSQPCSYKWKWFNGSYSETVSTDRTLKPTRVGSHRCEATCEIGNTPCTVNVTFAEVYSAAANEEITASTGQYMWALLVLLLAIVLIAVIIVGLRHWRRNRSKRSDLVPQEVLSITTDHSSTPLIAVNTEDNKQVKQSYAEPNKDLKGLSLLEGKPEIVGVIDRKDDKGKRITVLNDKLFVATENSPDLAIYDIIRNCTWLKTVHIPGMVNPFDLACCQVTQCLFVSDCKLETDQKEIIRIEPDMTVGHRWSTGTNFGNLSVSSESKIIMCVSNRNMLIECTRDGKDPKVIVLPELVHPCHAIKMSSGDFVVSHGSKNDALHRVCNVNEDGKVLRSFGGEKGNSLEQLNDPNYLIVDEVDNILVLDSGNKRALLFDSNLNVKMEFLTRHTGLLKPSKMCLCKATRKLFVVDSEYEVLIISIK